MVKGSGPLVQVVNAIPSYDERNGNVGLKDTDIKLIPMGFGLCKVNNQPCHLKILGEKWQKCNSMNPIAGRPSVRMNSFMVCLIGKGKITLINDGQKIRSIDDAYDIMTDWIMGGYSVVSKEELEIAMKYMAMYGEQTVIGQFKYTNMLNYSGNDDIGILQRINDGLTRESKYDTMILACANYWNMTMEKEYGELYSPVRADVIKAMMLTESNMGQDNGVDSITGNGQRDVMQALDFRNPVVWTCLGEPGNYRPITLIVAPDDVARLKVSNKIMSIASGDKENKGGGPSEIKFMGAGKWEAVKEIFSDDYATYYAEKVTAELSVFVGTSYYCRFLNGAGDNDGVSILQSEKNAVQKYNDDNPFYFDTVDTILRNMGVNEVAKD